MLAPMPRALPVLIPLLAMFAVQTMTSMADLTVPVLAPAAAGDTGVAATYIGVWMGVLYAAAMTSGLVAGGLVLRHGAVRVCQGAAGLAALGLGAFALAHPAAALMSAVLLGSAYGVVNPAASHVLAAQSPPRWRALIFSIKQSGVTLGGMLAGAVAPALAETVGWQGAALWIALVSLAIGAAMQPTRAALDADRQPDAARRSGSVAAPIRLILTTPVLRGLTVGAFFFSGVQVCLFSFYALYMTEALGLSLVAAGLAYASVQAGGVAGRLLWGAFSGGIISSGRMLFLLGGAAAALMLITGAYAAALSLPALFGVSALLGACALGWNGIYLSEVARLAPEGRIGEATGGAQFFFFAGAVIIPPVFGAVIGFTGGYAPAFMTTAAMSVAASLSVALALRRRG